MSEPSIQSLYEKHANLVFFYLIKLTNNNDLASDLMQETFIKAFRYLEKNKKVLQHKSWLLAIAHNEYRQHFRKALKQKSVPFELVDNTLEMSNDKVKSELEENLEQSDLFDRVKNKLTSYKQDFASVFILRVEYELTQKEISEVMKIPKITVRSHLKKIQAIIIQSFAEELNIK